MFFEHTPTFQALRMLALPPHLPRGGERCPLQGSAARAGPEGAEETGSEKQHSPTEMPHQPSWGHALSFAPGLRGLAGAPAWAPPPARAWAWASSGRCPESAEGSRHVPPAPGVGL